MVKPCAFPFQIFIDQPLSEPSAPCSSTAKIQRLITIIIIRRGTIIVYFVIAQISHYTTTFPLLCYLHINNSANLKANSAFLQSILFGELIEQSVPLMYNQPVRTDLPENSI